MHEGHTVCGHFGNRSAAGGLAAAISLLGPEGRTLEVQQTDHGPELRIAATGEPFSPTADQIYDGKLSAEERSLTVPEYITEPVLNDSRTGSIDRVATVLFVLLESFPLKGVTWTLATLCIILFFVTSSDSASMVIDIIASGGNPDPPVGTRLFWAITEGLVAAALLLAGGLNALQTASITAALPFCIVLILMCVSLTTALVRHESAAKPTARAQTDTDA